MKNGRETIRVARHAIIVLTFVVMAFASGAYLGNKHGVVSTTLLLSGIGSYDNLAILRAIDKKDFGRVIELTHQSVDEHIMELEIFRHSRYLIAPSDKLLASRSLNTLKAISIYRQSNPNCENDGWQEKDQRIQSILDSVIHEGKNSKCEGARQ